MTVKELIAALSTLPQDKQVILHDTCLGFWVACEDVNPHFSGAENAIALERSEVPDSEDWQDEDED